MTKLKVNENITTNINKVTKPCHIDNVLLIIAELSVKHLSFLNQIRSLKDNGTNYLEKIRNGFGTQLNLNVL